MVESRQRAQALIMSGLVFMGDQRMDKAGMAVDESAELRIRGQELTYVSRGGLKLEKAMKTFPIRLQGCLLYTSIRPERRSAPPLKEDWI